MTSRPDMQRPGPSTGASAKGNRGGASVPLDASWVRTQGLALRGPGSGAPPRIRARAASRSGGHRLPLPESETVVGLLVALLVMVSEPVKAWMAVGVNVTLSLQVLLVA